MFPFVEEVVLLTSTVPSEVEQSLLSCTSREASASKQTVSTVGQHWRQIYLSSTSSCCPGREAAHLG